jgi:membrane protein required for colicin V production
MVFDILLGGLLVLSVFIGIKRGLVREAMSIAGIIVCLLAAAFLNERCLALLQKIPFISTFVTGKYWALMFSFALTFILALIAARVIGLLLFGFLRRIRPTGLDRFLGLFLGVIHGVIWCIILVAFINVFPVFKADSWLNDTQVGTFFLYYATQAQNSWQAISGV